MLVRAAHGLPADAGIDRARLAEVTAVVAHHAQSPRIAIGMALHPALARDYGAAHIVLTAAGVTDARCAEALARADRAAVADARERPPHRELEQAWLGWLTGGPRPAPALVARTALGRGSDVLLGTRDDLYALTHALIYATDFGAVLPRMPRAAGAIAAECDSALAGVLDDDDFDLAAELLLAAPYLRRRWSPAAAFCFSVLTSVEDRVGVLPSLSLDRAGVERQAPAEREAYVAAVAYHTAYVMGLLCAAILAAPHRPQPPRQAAAASPLAERLLAELAAGPRRLQWVAVAQALTPRARAPLTSLLLDMALRRAARALDLAKVRALLIDGLEARVPPTPLRLQAAELLARLAEAAPAQPPAEPPDEDDAQTLARPRISATTSPLASA